jgi:hypothetical protein
MYFFQSRLSNSTESNVDYVRFSRTLPAKSYWKDHLAGVLGAFIGFV